MAPMEKTDPAVVEQQLKSIISSLYNLMVQVSAYDNALGPSPNTPHTSTPGSSTPSPNPNSVAARSGSSSGTAAVLASELRSLDSALQAVHHTASTPNPADSLPRIPPELIQYVENGRNPDIYTREFVELARRGNQLMRGKMAAFGEFRDTLASEMERALPEVREDVRRVVEATSGNNGTRAWNRSSGAGANAVSSEASGTGTGTAGAGS